MKYFSLLLLSLFISCQSENSFIGNTSSVTGEWQYIDIETGTLVIENDSIETTLKYSDNSKILDQKIDSINSGIYFLYSLLDPGSYLIQGKLEYNLKSSNELISLTKDSIISIENGEVNENLINIGVNNLTWKPNRALEIQTRDSLNNILPHVNVKLYTNLEIMLQDTLKSSFVRKGISLENGMVYFVKLNNDEYYAKLYKTVNDSIRTINITTPIVIEEMLNKTSVAFK